MSEEVKNNDLDEVVENATDAVEEVSEEVVSETAKEAKEVEEVKEEAKETVEEASKDNEEKAEKSKKDAEPSISKSKQKREARKKEVKAAKTKKIAGRVIEVVIELAIAGIFITAIVLGILQSLNKVAASSDYSASLDEEGYIIGEDLSTVKDIGLKNLVVPASEVVPTDETLDSKIDDLLESNKELSTDSSLEAATGDKINLDYVGTVDGVAFEGGDTNGEGTDLELGSGSYVDDFEDQLVGAHPGDSLTVSVTFPEDYGKEELNGKDAEFAVTVNGIYVKPEFTDEFVQAHYSDVASTADEYRQYLYDEDYDSNLENYLLQYINDNASVSKFPKGYVNIMKSLLYNTDLENYNYYNQMYQYYGMSLTFADYAGMSENAYFKELKTRAKQKVASTMTYDSIFKSEGLEVTDEMRTEVMNNYGGETSALEKYGEPFLKSTQRQLAVLEYLKKNVTVE